MEDFKPTNRKPLGKMGKKLEKQFSKNLAHSDIDLKENLYGLDSMLTEKEQTFKKKYWDLSKMESLVHSDPILSAEYEEMANDGQEKYGYHYNETIMNMLFNKYVTNDESYQQKYLNAVPKEKERRDKSGIEKLKQSHIDQRRKKRSKKKKEKKNENDVKIHNNSLEGVIEEDIMDNNLNRDGDGDFYDREYIIKRINKKYDTMNENDEFEYSPDDIVISSTGWKYSVGSESSNIKPEYFDEMDDALEYVRNWKKDNKFYPNTWFISDHGNMSLIDDEGNIVETTSASSSGSYSPALGMKAKNNVYENMDLESAKDKAKKISKEEGVAQHVNMISNDKYKIDDFYDSETTVASYENGRPLNEGKDSDDPCWDGYKQIGMKDKDGKEVPNCVPEADDKIDETTTSSSSGSYETKFAWAGKGKSRHSKKPAYKGGKIVSENYITDMNFFKKIYESVNSDSLVPMAEHHIDDREGQIDFIVKNSNGNFTEEMLQDVTDEGIDEIYRDLEKDMGLYEEGDNINEKAKSKKQQKFMGMVHAHKKGELPYASPAVKKAAKSMSDEDAEDFASTKHKGLPTKVKSKEEESIQEDKSSLNFSHKNILNLANKIDDAPAEDEEKIINSFISKADMSPAYFKNKVQNIIDTRYRGSESPDFFKLEYLVTILNDILDRDSDAKRAKEKEDTLRQYYRTPYGKREKDAVQERMEDDMGGMFEGILSNNQDSMISDNSTSMANTMKGTGVSSSSMGENSDLKNKNSKIDYSKSENELDDFGTSEDGLGGFNDKGDGRHPHIKDPKEMGAPRNKDLNEDKKPSALVQLDRLKKSNSQNFSSDLKDSNTAEISKGEDMASDQVEKVSENPYELGEKIEKEKMKENGFNSFENVGNSTNNNNKEIPKRNATDEESDQITKDRGLGMQDIVYDNEPDERFEERMEKDMGDDIYKQRKEKMDYRAKAPMYNKDTQPIDDGIEKNQFNKNKSGYNSKEGIDESRLISGKYVDDFGKTKLITFKLSECREVENVQNGALINFDGIGNIYKGDISENFEMRNLINKFNYYVSDNKVVRVKSNNQSLLNESDNKKTSINEEVEKMLRLTNYKPSSYIDTSKTKKNRGF